MLPTGTQPLRRLYTAVRSGSHAYRPSLDRSCCPTLPIRLDAASFQPSKPQNKAMRRLLEYLTGARAITLPDEDADTLSRVLAHAAAVGSAEAARVFCESRKDDHADADSDDEPLPPTGAAAAAPAPAALTCLTANSPAELAALRARYTVVRDRLEAEGAAARRADPSNADILLIEDDMGDGDELDGAEYSAADAGVATGAGEPSTHPELLQQQRRAAAQARKRAKALAKHIDKSREALDEFALMGVGAHMARLRSAAAAARAAACGSDGVPPGGVSAAAPPGSDASGACRASVAPLLPFGTGPHRLTVRLVRPRVDPEAHEIYTRFNMSIHHSRPGDNRREAYERRACLVMCPGSPMPPSAPNLLSPSVPFCPLLSPSVPVQTS